MQLFFYLASTFFQLTPFVANETFRIYQPFVTLVLIFIFLVIFLFKDRYFRLRLNTPNVSFALFTLINIVLLFDAYNVSQSLYQVLFYIQCFLIFICLQQVSNQYLLTRLSKTFVILTTIFGLFSITKFIDIGLTATHRLNGIVGPAGVYGGFLIIPLFLSIYFLLNEKAVWPKRFWYISFSIIFTSFFLTFSYDAWAVVVITILVALFLLKKSKKDYNLKSIIKPLSFVLIISFAFFCSIWYMALETTNDRTVVRDEVVQYERASFEGGFLRSRFEHYTNALNVFLYSPITGFGASSYAEISKAYGVYSEKVLTIDPYNWFLKLLTEGGIIIATIFAIFVVSVLSKCFKSLLQQKEGGILFCLTIALGAGVLHGLVNSDWSTKAVFLVWIVFAGLVFGLINNKKADEVDKEKFFPSWSMYVLFVVIILTLIVTIQLLRADTARAKGDYYFANKEYDNALNSYFRSATFNSYDDVTWYDLWRVYFAMNRQELAKDNIKRANQLSRYNEVYRNILRLSP